MYERKISPLLPFNRFLVRLAKHGLLAAAVMAAALGLGICGYHFTEGLSWLDSLLNASMILSGMGPVNPLATVNGKLFASCYALLSGVLFISLMGILLSPVFHRLIHRFHLEDGEKAKKSPAQHK